ncbi:MAG: hypothetical protein IAF38_19570 [Bacteroidia bacterium]|nr:hypothetical protein [Bacteroidia bacterium]
MKRVICIIIVFIYTVSVSGMVVQQRFCDNELIETGLAGTLDDCCMMASMPDCNKNCCLEKSEIVKVETAHEKPESLKNLKIVAPVLFLNSFSQSLNTISLTQNNFSEVKILPQKIPLRLLHSVFRI